MEPKKARIAIALTIVIALAIISVCLCMLFDFKPFEGKDEEADSTASPAPTMAVTATAEPTAEATPEPSPVPGPSDLKGCSDDMYIPKSESYLPAYVDMMTYAEEEGGTVSLQYKPEKKEFSRHVIMELPHQTRVTAIAQENGYTLVLVKEGVAGWILTQELENYQ